MLNAWSNATSHGGETPPEELSEDHVVTPGLLSPLTTTDIT